MVTGPGEGSTSSVGDDGVPYLPPRHITHRDSSINIEVSTPICPGNTVGLISLVAVAPVDEDEGRS